MRQQRHIARLDAVAAHCRIEGCQHSIREITRRCKRLRNADPAAHISYDRYVRERTADVDPNAPGHPKKASLSDLRHATLGASHRRRQTLTECWRSCLHIARQVYRPTAKFY